jgi:predicted RNA-binding protein with PIN domain
MLEPTVPSSADGEPDEAEEALIGAGDRAPAGEAEEAEEALVGAGDGATADEARIGAGDGAPAGGATAAGEGGMPMPLPVLAEALLVGYLDAAVATLRASSPGDLPGQLRQYQSWTPRRLKHPRVLTVIRRSLDLDQRFRNAVDDRVLLEEDVLARLLRAGRHAEALASGEPPEAVARVGLALGRDGQAAVHAAEDALVRSRAQEEAAAARSALAGAESELEQAKARADEEAAAARAAKEELRAVRQDLRRAEREIQTLNQRCMSLEQEVSKSAATLQAARAHAADEQRRLGGRIAELQALLAQAQRQYRALRKASGQIDPVVAEAVGALERDLSALRRATGIETSIKGPSGPPGARQPERREPLPVPGGLAADAPETLAAWMATPEVLVLVDGYNVTKHERGFPDRTLEDQRTLLLDLCRRLARRWGAEITVVFDGANVAPMPTRLPLGPIGMVFTDAGRTADDEIVARVNAAPAARPVVVVTSDNELRERSAALGANVSRSTALLGLANR